MTLESLSEKLNFGLTIFFALEMTVKLLSLGLTWYIKDRMNVFDAIVVLISLVELAVAPPEFLSGHPGTNNAAVLALRTLRLARIFKLARSWTSLRLLLRMLAESMQGGSTSLVDRVITTLRVISYALIGRRSKLCRSPRPISFYFWPVRSDALCE